MKWHKAVVDHVTKARGASINTDLESGVFTVGEIDVSKGGDEDKGGWTYDTETNSWINTNTGEVFSNDGKDGDSKDSSDSKAADDGKNDWLYDEKSGEWVNKSSGEKV
jgi:hypothetical protein